MRGALGAGVEDALPRAAAKALSAEPTHRATVSLSASSILPRAENTERASAMSVCEESTSGRVGTSSRQRSECRSLWAWAGASGVLVVSHASAADLAQHAHCNARVEPRVHQLLRLVPQSALHSSQELLLLSNHAQPG